MSNNHFNVTLLEPKTSPHPSQQFLRREPFTPAMLKTMERTRLWIDERLEINFGEEEDNDEVKLKRHDSYDDTSSFPGSHNSDGETRCTTLKTQGPVCEMQPVPAVIQPTVSVTNTHVPNTGKQTI